jgi:hypothetical protein
VDRDLARATIEPFYDLFRADRRDWERGLGALSPDWKAYYTNGSFRTKESTRPYLQGLFDLVPDIDVRILQVTVGGDVIAVRSELSGTPAAAFLVPYSGKSFSIMTIDLHTVGSDGSLTELFHAEDWGTAISQLGEPAK